VLITNIDKFTTGKELFVCGSLELRLTVPFVIPVHHLHRGCWLRRNEKKNYEAKDKSKIERYYNAFLKYCDVLTTYIRQLQ